MKKNDKSDELLKKLTYLSHQLQESAQEMLKLDFQNLNLIRQKKRALSVIELIKNMQKEIENAFTVDDLYANIVKSLTLELDVDFSALLKIDYKTKKVATLASDGLLKKTKLSKLVNNLKKKDFLIPAYVNSQSFLTPFQQWLKKNFSFPYFIWYPFTRSCAFT